MTADEIADPHALDITLRVNGVEKQHSNTRHLIFNIPRLIAEWSAGMTLYPGDILLTGTPSGVGVGRKPPEFLKPGDVVEVESGIGVLRNVVGSQERTFPPSEMLRPASVMTDGSWRAFGRPIPRPLPRRGRGAQIRSPSIHSFNDWLTGSQYLPTMMPVTSNKYGNMQQKAATSSPVAAFRYLRRLDR